MAHGVEEAKQKALFLTRIGQTAYSKLKTLVGPTPLAELDLNTIVEKLAEHYRPDTVEIAERLKFFKRQQNDEEGVTEYMAELRKLAKTCNFGSYLDTALRDQLVCGLKDPRIQRELLCVQKLTVAQALERARAMEAVAKEAKHLQFEGGNTEADGAPTHQMRRAEKLKCHRCGSTDHLAAKCSHKDKRCHKCHKVGHLARVCKSTKARVGTRSRNTRVLEADSRSSGSGDESDELGATLAGVHKVAQGGSKYQKLITTLKIKGKNIDFEVDTGAELSTIPAALYRAKLKEVELESLSVILHQYDGTALPTMGEIVVEVFHGQQLVKGRFIIMEKVDTQLPLLGRVQAPP